MCHNPTKADWKWTGMCVLALVLLTLAFGCQAVGVADPDVRAASYDVTDALVIISDHADNPEMVGTFAALALERAQQFVELEDKLTDIDKLKVKQLVEGLQSLFDRREDEAYVILRSFSLSKLAASVGLYSHDGLKMTREMIEEAQGAQTQPGGGDGAGSKADHGEGEGSPDGRRDDGAGEEGVPDSE